MRIWIQLPTEQFTPSELIEQAQAAEEAGFDAINLSDHLQPWWEGGESGQAWALLGAIGQATEKIGLGTGVTSTIFRYNPVVIAQFIATIEQMFPGRAYLGVGSGEALNESPCGMHWPPPAQQVERLDESLAIISALLDGERVDHEGTFYRTKAAYLHTRGDRRPPVYVSAFGSKSAAVAARRGEGLWTLADPERAPKVIAAYRDACEQIGTEPGEIILQAGMSWASDDDAAFEGCRVWKAAQPFEFFRGDWHDPKTMSEHAESQISDEDFRNSFIVSSDPNEHVVRLSELAEMGATVICVQNASGADPLGALRVYGEQVLPRLRAFEYVGA